MWEASSGGKPVVMTLRAGASRQPKPMIPSDSRDFRPDRSVGFNGKSVKRVSAAASHPSPD